MNFSFPSRTIDFLPYSSFSSSIAFAEVLLNLIRYIFDPLIKEYHLIVRYETNVPRLS